MMVIKKLVIGNAPMKKQFVVIDGNEGRAGTVLIAEGFGRRHEQVTRLVEKYREKFEKINTLNVFIKPGKTKSFNEFSLTEDQFIFLATLFKNNDQVVEFKLRLVKDYSRCRKQLAAIQAQRKTPEWFETREKGKIARLEATDEIKQFLAYAKEQGSQNANWYYVNLTTMLNDLLFIVRGKFKNLREMMTPIQLMIVSGGDLVIRKALVDGMKKKTFYKDIYKLARERVEIFATLHGQSEIISKQLSLFDG